MGLRPVLSDMLDHAELLKFLYDPGCHDKSYEQCRDYGKGGPEGNIPEDIEWRINFMKRIKQFIEHLLFS